MTPPTTPFTRTAKPTWMTEWADFDPFTTARDDGSAGSGFTCADRTMAAGTGIGTQAVPHLANGSDNTAAQTPVTLNGGAFTSTIPARSLVSYEVRS